MKLSSLKAKQDQVWVDEQDGLRLLIGRFNSPLYKKCLKEFAGTKAKQFAQGRVSEDEAKDYLYKVAAHSLVLGWENMQDEDGSDLDYSPEIAIECFKDVPEFYDLIFQYSREYSLFFVENKKAELGN